MPSTRVHVQVLSDCACDAAAGRQKSVSFSDAGRWRLATVAGHRTESCMVTPEPEQNGGHGAQYVPWFGPRTPARASAARVRRQAPSVTSRQSDRGAGPRLHAARDAVRRAARAHFANPGRGERGQTHGRKCRRPNGAPARWPTRGGGVGNRRRKHPAAPRVAASDFG